MRPLLLFIVFALLPGCFAIPDGVVFRCDANHACPEGLVCLANQMCGPTVGGDLGVADAAADLQPAYGCTVPNGQAIGRAFACPVAALAKNQAASLCAPGYQLCTNGTDLQAAPLCRTIAGFFAADVFGTTPGSPDNAVCQSTAHSLQVFFGCGRIQLNTVLQANMPCQAFERVIDCNPAAGTGWTCGRTLADTSTSVAAGVLCCPR